MGRFLLGSTVVMLWPQNMLVINQHWGPGLGVRLGEKMSESNI
jgi:phosphatidylserine decarboxylase